MFARRNILRKLIKDVGKSIKGSAKSGQKVTSSLEKYNTKSSYYENYAARQVDVGLGTLGAATGIHYASTDFIDRFGDEMSGFGRFAAGFGSTAVTAGMGAHAFTRFGRASLAKFGGGSQLRSIRTDLKEKRIKKHRQRLNKAREDIDYDDVLAPPLASSRLTPGRKQLSGAAIRQRFGKNRQQETDLFNKFEKNVNAGEKGRKQLFAKKRPGAKRSNIDKVKNVLAVENAQKFSTMGMFGKALALPGGLFGAMAGKGTLYGKADPTMKFIGSSIPIGLGSGMLGGLGVGMYSATNRNLGRTRGPRGRQQRSFSNLNHNATLQSHGMNSNALR